MQKIVPAVGAVLGCFLGLAASGLAVGVGLLYFEIFLAVGVGHEFVRFSAQCVGGLLVLSAGGFSGRSGHRMGRAYLESEPSAFSICLFAVLGPVLLISGFAAAHAVYPYLKALLTSKLGPTG